MSPGRRRPPSSLAERAALILVILYLITAIAEAARPSSVREQMYEDEYYYDEFYDEYEPAGKYEYESNKYPRQRTRIRSRDGGGSGGGGYSGGGGGGSNLITGLDLNPLAALLAPLAAIALLGAASLISANPTLITLGVVGGNGRRKRRRRSTSDISSSEMQVLEKFFTARPQLLEQTSESLLASYLKCSGFMDEGNGCLERAVCEFGVQNGRAQSGSYSEIIQIIYSMVQSNPQVTNRFKQRLQRAAQLAPMATESSWICAAYYPCEMLNTI